MRVLLAVLLLALTGCPGERERPADARQTSPDLPPAADRARADWPNPMYPDGYVAQPFGCARDGDCFGQRCCPTPWGVKLCAAVCGTP